jgi:uncharacterized protein (DUF302 family)
MKFKLLTLALAITLPVIAHADNGLIKVKSAFDVNTTTDRLEKILTSKGMTIFNRIHHSDSAEKVGITIRPTQLLIFGNPKVGSPLMACQQSFAIDLPQKALITQDENNQVWLTYNDPKYIAKRHELKGCEQSLNKVEKALATFAQKATQP